MQDFFLGGLVAALVALSGVVMWLYRRQPVGDEESGITRLIRAKQSGIEAREAQAWIESGQRFKLARAVVVLSVGVLAVLVGIGLWPQGSQFDKVKEALTVLLPVLGTWVGTVLAFYFARESLEAASASARELVMSRGEETLAKVLVRSAMIRRGIMQVIKLNTGQGDADITLDALNDVITTKSVSRVPILTADDSARYVVHKSTLYQYSVETGQPLKDLKLDGLVAAHPGISSIAFVSLDATLDQAKTAMETKEGCQDVIVTKTGAPGEKVEGWVTNVDFERYSQI